MKPLFADRYVLCKIWAPIPSVPPITCRAAANGDATCIDPFHLPKMHLFNGKLVVIVQAAEKAGKISLKANSKKLKGETTIVVSGQ